VAAVGRGAAWTAGVLGLASATVSAYWTAGGTALLDTVGGAVEQLARERSAGALVLGGAVVVAKLVAALLALAQLARPGRGVRVLALLTGGLLVLWGGANVLLGGAVLSGVLDLGPVADERALRWHVLVWDAWFLVWGVALLVAVRRTRHRAVLSGAARSSPVPRTPARPAPRAAPERRPRGR
jgi:uncharacterized membrane protein